MSNETQYWPSKKEFEKGLSDIDKTKRSIQKLFIIAMCALGLVVLVLLIVVYFLTHK